MESRLVGLEHAEVNNAWSNQQAASVDNFSFRRNIHLPSGKNAVALQQKNTPLAGLPCRIDKSAVGYGEKSVHAHPSTPLALRVSTSRRSEEHTSELQSLMRISYAVFCLKNKTPQRQLH